MFSECEREKGVIGGLSRDRLVGFGCVWRSRVERECEREG